MERATFAGFNAHNLASLLDQAKIVDIFDLHRNAPVQLSRKGDSFVVCERDTANVLHVGEFTLEALQQFLALAGQHFDKAIGQVLIVVRGGCAYPVASKGVDVFVADLDSIAAGDEQHPLTPEWQPLLNQAELDWPMTEAIELPSDLLKLNDQQYRLLQIYLQIYEEGVFSHIRTQTELEKSGDGLLQYLMLELADSEDCSNDEEALNRIRQTGVIIEALQERYQQFWCEIDNWAVSVCDMAGIDLVEAQEPEILGRWDWLDRNGNASECSLETKQAAAVNALESLYPKADWQRCVAEGQTQYGYQQWILQREQDKLLDALAESV